MGTEAFQIKRLEIYGEGRVQRADYFNFIEEKLNILVVRVKSRGKLNILDFNLHSESFFQYFFNHLFKWQLENQNAAQHNAPGLDLIDKGRKLLVQVSATATKQKINSSLSKDFASYPSHSFKFIAIDTDVSSLKTQTYDNPHGLIFDPKDDIYDVVSILRLVKDCHIDDLKSLFELVRKELSVTSDRPQVESHLASIIKILGEVDWELVNDPPKTTEFELDRKIDHNDLEQTRSIIDEFALYTTRLDKIYGEFNKQGRNKSRPIWHQIRHEYRVHMQSFNGDELFNKVVDAVIERIRTSANYSGMPLEDLSYCSSILVVDAFMRCKIFKEPPKVTSDAIA